MKNRINALRAKGANTAIALTCILVSSGASAALPVEATTAFTSLTTDLGSLEALAWPFAIAVTVAVTLVGLFKKFVGVSKK